MCAYVCVCVWAEMQCEVAGTVNPFLSESDDDVYCACPAPFVVGHDVNALDWSEVRLTCTPCPRGMTSQEPTDHIVPGRNLLYSRSDVPVDVTPCESTLASASVRARDLLLCTTLVA